MKRCDWCQKDELYRNYHDQEWAVPCWDDAVLFENLVLESFQAGLSWYTVLAKRENFRRAFYNFDAIKMSQMGDSEVDTLLNDAGIIRHKAKILAAINNAKCYLKIIETQSFSSYIWAAVNGKVIVNNVPNMQAVKSKTTQSDELAKKLKKDGFKFMGSTTCYAYMQAMGLVNDHLNYCFKKE